MTGLIAELAIVVVARMANVISFASFDICKFLWESSLTEMMMKNIAHGANVRKNKAMMTPTAFAALMCVLDSLAIDMSMIDDDIDNIDFFKASSRFFVIRMIET